MNGSSLKNNFLFNVSAVLFVIVAISSVINIGFKVSNTKLENAIEILEDEKANLRAKYLSDIALGKLGSKAGEMEMKYVSNKECFTISGQKHKNKSPQTKTKDPVKKSRISVSGY